MRDILIYNVNDLRDACAMDDVEFDKDTTKEFNTSRVAVLGMVIF